MHCVLSWSVEVCSETNLQKPISAVSICLLSGLTITQFSLPYLSTGTAITYKIQSVYPFQFCFFSILCIVSQVQVNLLTVNFLQHFLMKSLSTESQQAGLMCCHTCNSYICKFNVCICHELWRGKAAAACLLCISPCTGYIPTFL